MNQSENINELVAALSKAQGEMQPAVFNKTNPFFKGSKYADFNSCMDACRIPLSKNGLSLIQCPASIEDKPVLVTKIYHVSGQWISSEMPLYLKNQDMQGLGSAITYAKRYSLSAMLGIIADEDANADDDGNAAKGLGNAPRQQAKPEPLYINQGQQKQLNELLNNLGVEDKESFLRRLKVSFGTEITSEIPLDGFDKAMTALRAQVKISNQMVTV